MQSTWNSWCESKADDRIHSGDSYSQTGFVITDTKATAGNILGNPAFPGYTTTNGYNVSERLFRLPVPRLSFSGTASDILKWIDYLIATYNKTLVLSYNFAYGGATVDASLVAPYETTVLSFVDQTTEFSTYLVPAPSTAQWTASNALFAAWFGVNDVGNAWYESNWTTIAEAVVTRYFQETQIMYNAGARNFLFLTVPPTQYTPLVVAEGTATQTQWGDAVTYFNGLLTAAAASFKSTNSGSTVYVYDTTTPFMTAIDNPTAYGAPNATCFNADGVSCLWWNNYHPGQAIHKLVAQGIAALTGI